MAGFLDFLQQGDNPLGLALLAAGGPTTDPNQAGFGYRLASAAAQAQGSRDAQADRALKLRFTNSQIAENDSQAAARTAAAEAKRQQMAWDQYFLTGEAPGGVAPVGGMYNGMTAAQISQEFGIPMAAIVADHKSGGKKLAEFINERTKPKIELVNGTPFDLNKATLGQELPNYRAGKIDDRRISLMGTTQQIPQADGSTATVSGESLMPPPPGPVTAPRSGPAIAMDPLGVRNNNPGNLRPPGANTGFQQFGSPDEGLAALDRNLQSYGQKGINTIEGVINRWAPPSENNTGAYVNTVAKRLGVDPKAQIDLSSPYVRQALSTAIMLQENGPSILTRTATTPPIGPNGVLGRTQSTKEKNAAEVDLKKELATQEVDTFKTKENIKAENDRKTSAGKAIPTLNDGIKTIDEALKHPGFSAGTGISSVADPRNYIPGTDAFNFGQRVNQIKGKAFLTAIESLRGTGQITEIEGAKATDAVARLNRAQSEKEYKVALGDLRSAMQTALDKAKNDAGAGAPASNSGGASGSWDAPAGWTVRQK